MIKKFLKYHPAHKKIAPKFDTIFLLRPTIFFSVWVMVVVGIISAELNMNATPLWIIKFSWEIFFVFLGITLLISSTFIFSQIADAKNGYDNQKILLIGKYISAEKGLSIARILLILRGLISIIANWITAVLAIGIFFLRRIGYNQAPFEWMKAPFSIWLVNSFFGVLLFIIGWILGMGNYPSTGIIPLSIDTLFHMLPYVLGFSAVSLLATLPDIKGSTPLYTRDYPTVLGTSTSLLLSLFMIIIALYYSIKHSDPLASTATLVSLPFFVFVSLRRLKKDIIRAICYPIFIINFFTLSYYPWLVVPLLCTYYLSKYYYWHRFDVHYPTFLVDND